MVRQQSTMMELGTTAPAFSLPDTDGTLISLEHYDDAKGYLVMFICNHCPYVKHVADELSRLGNEYQKRGVAVFAVQSNDIENYPEDGPDKMKAEKTTRGYEFPYLFDATQEVALAYRAACTPDFFLFDSDRKLVYRGQLDDARPKNDTPVTGRDLRTALDAMLAGKPCPQPQLPSMGCNIKWKAGNEPDYFAP